MFILTNKKMRTDKKYSFSALAMVILTLATLLSLSGCKKLLEIKTPSNQLESKNIYLDSVSAQATVNGLYTVMYNTTSGGTVVTTTYGTFLTTCQGRSADEVYAPASTTDEFVNNSLVPTTGLVNTVWVALYQTIYQANKVIEGMEASALSPTLKRQLIGEAKFLRAYAHFHLVNLWGDVPLITTTEVSLTSIQGRNSTDVVYAQMIQDLKDAQGALSTNYSWSANLRTRANSSAATALLARVYLYNKQYALAEQEASKIIAQTALYTLPSALNTVFLKASNETIWAFNTNQFGYPFIGRALLPTSATVDPSLALTPSFLSAFERDATRADYEDDRYAAWTKAAPSGLRYAAKYISNTAAANTEFQVVLRLAEQYLIRAEARIQQNNLTGGISDLNVIRTRAGLHGTFATTQADLLLAVEHERQIELFLEYGTRFYDLKRTGRIDAVLGAVKGTIWGPTDALYPIPTTQINANVNLSQNKGY
ncbi:RagB/SusD family nutrient uptake outer membrane protein [Pedobacter frigiditerrae]|uniref:RagB/SusD family nutrient uptake outer membrane protein n=2 Tax=Pedobacter frigiditerrae TaxID=2530452 RepID=A0A4R0MP18_9SPHI|nr:RagB/SusD family nutrient uptake outer membrane protein [Pedobacter frigiditerrae]